MWSLDAFGGSQIMPIDYILVHIESFDQESQFFAFRALKQRVSSVN